MTIEIGQKVPSVKVKVSPPNGAGEVVTTDAFFAGKKVVLFAVPGAFTSTCSNHHLPGFVKRAEEFAGKGVDLVACIAVNDPAVMSAWGREHGTEGKITLLSDGNGDFARAMGLTVDLSAHQMGVRSQRYAAVFEDGTLSQLAVEAPGKFEVSSCEAVLSKL
jgi:peroxiredoxin